MVEIRWHGRGGQGAKTAALLLADAAMNSGKFIQAFPEYGPERMGAPVQSFNRLSDEPITMHCGITSPDIVIILDSTLMATVDVAAGIKDDGIIIINTPLSPGEMRKKMGINGKRIFTIDASGISKNSLGREIPNTPMLGALLKVSGLLDLQGVLNDTKKKLEKKFRSKPELIEGNIRAIKRAYEEVKGE